MTAQDLIESIFSRPQGWVSGDVRRITPDQLKFLRDLIAADPERDQVHNGQGGSLVWSPAGHRKYVLTEDPNGGKRHTLTRLSCIEASTMGSLF